MQGQRSASEAAAASASSPLPASFSRPVRVIERRNWLQRAIDRLMWHLSGSWAFRVIHLVPSLPKSLRRFVPREGMWRAVSLAVPPELKTVPGISRDPAKEEAAHREQPLHDWDVVHAKAHDWYRRYGWRAFLPVMPSYFRVHRAMARAGVSPRAPMPARVDPAELRRNIEDKAAELGISAVAVARFDRKYSCAEHAGLKVGDRVIVCALEQSYEAMLTIPSWAAERAAQECTVELKYKCLDLARHLHGLGYRACANPRWIAVQYAVAAGLGQLGMNGQLLTPVAGSRCRLEVISTDAPLPFDAPVDYGINQICDECQICARRCPPGAIPRKRKEYRGVTKSKLNAARCFPTVAQAAGCAICMKVCPVQRYGLSAVLDEYARTKRILGKGTDELEGYDFVDGLHYGPGQNPKLPKSFFSPSFPPGFDFDPTRKVPEGRDPVSRR